MADGSRGPWQRKLLWTVVIAAAVWFASGAVGFPVIFRWFFVGYVALALPFYLLLDAPPGRLPRHALVAILAFFVVVSGILTAAGFLLPQYEPRVEQEKIKRLQQAALEKEAAKRLESLRQLGAKQGLQLVRAGEVPGGATGAPDPKLIAQGQQVYNDYECYNCHKLGGKGGVKRRGPEMDDVGSVVSAEMFRAKILDPLVFLTEGYEEEYKKVIMPDDFKERMGPKEIDALVAYMVSLKAPGQKTPKPLFKSPKGWGGVPVEHQKVMPSGWWMDDKAITQGKQIYEGTVKSDVVCAACHGRDGQPLMTGARDFRDKAYVEKMSDTYWFWRLSEGVPQTAMTPMKEKLTEEERWQVIAYQHTFSHGGKAEEHAH